ncbi:hypothetical protein Tco_1422945 [Tanacetum coccineum]
MGKIKDLLRKCPHHGFSPLHQIDFFYNGLSQSDQDSLNTVAGGNLMSKNTQEALTIIENKAKVRTCRNKPQVSSSSGISTQIDAITALTKQVEALEYHIDSMRETYDHNQEASIQLMQNQIGQIAKAFQERPSCVPPSNTSIPLILPPETPPLSAPKPKEDPKPNPYQPSIPYPSRLQEERFQALENPTGRVDHLVYRIDIVDSLCDKFPIKNNSLSVNLIPSSDSVFESLSLLPTPFGDSDSLVEEADILLYHFYDSSPDYETFCFDIEEKSSGITTSHSNHSLSEYESFCFDVDHIEEKSSGSTTSHSDFSLPEYESFHFDLSIDPLPPTDRSVSHHEEFADELAHIISPPEYGRFYFDLEIDPGEFPRLLKETSTKDLTIHELNDFPLLLPDCDSTFFEEFSKIDPLVSFPFGNKDKIFDPRIFIIKGVQSLSFHILSLDNFSTTSFVSDSLLLTDPSEIKTFLSFPFGNEDKVFDPGILIIDGISLSRENLHIF